jgi:hypothetical protein
MTSSDYIIAEFDDHYGADQLAKHMGQRGLVCVVKPIRKRDELVDANAN